MPPAKFCWDSGVFVAWLTAEPRSEEELAGLREVVDLADSRRAIIVTSSLAFTEVLGDQPHHPVRDIFANLFRRPQFISQDPTPAISNLAADVRDELRADGRSLQTPDAVMLATAIAHHVDALHTFDGHLLRLNGHRAAHGIVICKPQGVQTLLNF